MVDKKPAPKFDFGVIKIAKSKTDLETDPEESHQFVYAKKMLNPLTSQFDGMSGFRIDRNIAKVSSQADHSSLCSTQHDLLEKFVTDEIVQRQSNFLVMQAIIITIIYLFVLRLGLLSTLALLLLESAVLMAYILDFKNLDKVFPGDIFGLLSSGQERVMSFGVMTICGFFCGWIHMADLSERTSANIHFWLFNLIVGMGLAFSLMVQKRFKNPESSKKLGPTKKLLRFSQNFVSQSLFEYAITTVGILVFLIIEELQRVPNPTHSGEVSIVYSARGLSRINIKFCLEMVLRVFVSIQIRGYFFKVYMCSEIDMSELFYRRESACFSIMKYNKKREAIEDISAIVQRHAIDSLTTNPYLMNAILRNSSDPNQTLCYWTQILLFGLEKSRRVQVLIEMLNSAVKKNAKQSKNMDFMEKIQL